jgi:hypothetical protein
LVASLAVLGIGWGSAASAQVAHSPHHSHVRIALTATGGISVSNVGLSCNSTDTVVLSPSNELYVIAIPKRNLAVVFLHGHGDGSSGKTPRDPG